MSGLIAAALAFSLHEVLGHGATAWFLGGRFLGFFISPTAAFAETGVTPEIRGWVTAAGTPVNLATGILAYVWLRRRSRSRCPSGLLDVALFQFAHASVLFQLSYVGALPLYTWLTGQAPQGDWGNLFSWVGVPAVVAALVALPLGLVAAASLARTAARVTPWPHVVRTRWGIVKAYLTLAAPPLVLTALYALIELPWTESRDYFEFQGVVGTPLTLGLAGAALADWRDGRRGDASPAEAVMPVTAMAGLPVALMLAATIGIGLIFGPTIPLRRGVAVQRPGPDDYLQASHDVLATITLTGGARATLVVTSETMPARGSYYLRRFTHDVAGVGPSAAAAAEFTQFFTERNLGGARFAMSQEPRRTGSGWRWAGSVQFPGSRVQIRIWPSIYSRGGRIVGVTIVGGTLRPGQPKVEGLESANGTINWRRADGMEAPVGFVLEIS